MANAELPEIMQDLLVDPSLLVLAYAFSIGFSFALVGLLIRRLRGTGAEDQRGAVRVGHFKRLDLFGAGWIVAIYAWLSLAQVAVAGHMGEVREIAIPDIWVSIGFQGFMAGIVMAPRVSAVDWLGLRWPRWKAVFFLAPISVVAMWMVFGLLEAGGFMKWLESLGVETMQESVRALQKRDDLGFLVLMRFSAIVVAPICEEIVFRGYLYGVAKRYCGPLAAAMSSALVFSAAHASLVALLPLALFGLLLAWLYERTGSIWAPIAVHACFNAATVVVLMVQA